MFKITFTTDTYSNTQVADGVSRLMAYNFAVTQTVPNITLYDDPVTDLWDFLTKLKQYWDKKTLVTYPRTKTVEVEEQVNWGDPITVDRSMTNFTFALPKRRSPADVDYQRAVFMAQIMGRTGIYTDELNFSHKSKFDKICKGKVVAPAVYNEVHAKETIFSGDVPKFFATFIKDNYPSLMRSHITPRTEEVERPW